MPAYCLVDTLKLAGYEALFNYHGEYELQASSLQGVRYHYKQLAAGAPSAMRGPGQDNCVRFILSGDLIELYINNRRVASVRDTTHTSGVVQLQIESSTPVLITELRIDEVTVPS